MLNRCPFTKGSARFSYRINHPRPNLGTLYESIELIVYPQCFFEKPYICTTQYLRCSPGLLAIVNLPGWRWATITKVALDRLSRSLHSDVCDSDGCRDAVVHSRISGRGSWRFRAAPNNNINPPTLWWSYCCLYLNRPPICSNHMFRCGSKFQKSIILAEGAIALPVTLSGGVLFAS